jgi:uncharacterized protein (TIGR02145 family)
MKYGALILFAKVFLNFFLLNSFLGSCSPGFAQQGPELNDTSAVCDRFIGMLMERERTYRTYVSSGKTFEDASAVQGLNSELLAHLKEHKDYFKDMGVAATALDSVVAHLVNWNNAFERQRNSFQKTLGTDIPGATRFAIETAGSKGDRMGKVAQKLITSCLCGKEARLDYNGHTYTLVGIGDRCWFAENLTTATFANGDSIANISNSKQWKDLTTGAWAHYGNENANERAYGKLYNWHAVGAGQGLCPNGWHVPYQREWYAMLNFIDATANDPEAISFIGWNAGGRMKTKGTRHWQSPNLGATNESGFSALPGGQLGHQLNFEDINVKAHWWSASERNRNEAWYYAVTSYSVYPMKESAAKFRGFSVRCVKN